MHNTERRENRGYTGGILAHISSLEKTQDQVNEKIEATIEITREIESSVVKCEEFETDFATGEADSIKISALLQFDTVGYVTVDGKLLQPYVQNFRKKIEEKRRAREQITMTANRTERL
ncbi:hypothetical protein LR48_Vigan01g218400 [Vigna angularis]|uniref:Uncharacterized protein n=2 Tax=Phaseolus angularis TaxID=3914 RepID=A0A0L9TPV5_PHAAN|nr:uncharacterized protein HKW66_Vig0031430 [Vigna angularis]KOM32628.1 hypothetical protein LR48_Vigan01g218400 [Vigna angularis]BAT75896.1 hypothetical protein VIGAN_01382800 [Vigna angularis var. angularis]